MRVTRGFAFIDVSGFTALTDLEGDERAVQLISFFRHRLRELCSRRGVRIAKWLGDGAMLVCVDTRALVAATLEAQYRMATRTGRVDPIDIRTGISSGPVILLEGDDYIGHAVNRSARLCDMAGPGEVLCTEGVLESLPKWGTCLDTSDRTLRGIDRPVPVTRLSYRPEHADDVHDPVCDLPLSAATAEMSDHDAFGRPVLFCSDSCHDTWRNRPAPKADDPGSPRRPLDGG
jgi:class 3 adenylate cyclase